MVVRMTVVPILVGSHVPVPCGLKWSCLLPGKLVLTDHLLCGGKLNSGKVRSPDEMDQTKLGSREGGDSVVT